MSAADNLPKSSRFSLAAHVTTLPTDSSVPQWSTPAGSLEKYRYIHTSGAGPIAGHRPFQSGAQESDTKPSMESSAILEHLEIDYSHVSYEPNSIPVYEYGRDFVGDPILFVESVSEVGKKYGAIKVKMGPEFAEQFLSSRQINPDSFIFQSNKVLNNPSENELCSRLRFYNELIRFHTGHLSENESTESEGQPNGLSDQNVKNVTLETGTNSENALKSEAETGGVSTESVKVEGPANSASAVAENHESFGANTGVTVKSEPAPETAAADFLQPENLKRETLPDQKHPARPKVPMFLAKVPMMDKRPLDLYELFRFVILRGGYNEVIKKKLWAQIGRELGYKSRVGSSLSTWLKISYARILYPFELSLGDRKYEVASLAHQSNEQELKKRAKLNSGAPLILGSARELPRSVKIKAAKGFLINTPHLADLKPSLVLGTKDTNVKSEEEKPEKKQGHEKKTEDLILPLSSAAQVNNFVKWLALSLALIQDSSRLSSSSKHANTLSLRQFIEKDTKFREALASLQPQNVNFSGSDQVQNSARKVTHHEFEKAFWEFTAHKGESSILDGMRIELGSCISTNLADSAFPRPGNSFLGEKERLFAQKQIKIPTEKTNGAILQHGEAITPQSEVSYETSITTPQLADTQMISNTESPKAGPLIQPRFSKSPQDDLKILNPFNLHNIPILPNSLLGAYTSLDLNNRDLTNSTLSAGMTFSTENWKCEDHFTQLCNYHIYGARKRWYFIPESEFEKFEALIEELAAEKDEDLRRVNINYIEDDWQFEQLAKVINTDEEIANAEYDCLLKSLESMVNPYPDTRVDHRSENFQALIEKHRKKRRILLNQERFISPQLLTEKGINFTTTVQEPGEYVFKFPKTYSATISHGLNVTEEVNFALKMWLDYAEEGELWLAKQGLLPNFLTFRLLVNFAQLYELSDLTHIHFDAEIYAKVLALYSKLLEKELALRQKLRGSIKIKETTVEEKNVSEADNVSDDSLQNAFPLKIVITETSTHQQFVMTLSGFLQYLSELSAEDSQVHPNLVADDDYTFEHQMLYSDDKLRNFQKLLSTFSVDFEGWLANYDELMKLDEDITIKTYKALLSDGWKIYSALLSSNDNFKQFTLGSKAQKSGTVGRVKYFKEQVENLQLFVDESMELAEECQTILALKHQQRIRGGDAPQVNRDSLGESFQLFLKVMKKIPKANFYTPEFDQIFEFKNEIENFDRACRALILRPLAAISEFNDMISLGTSFGIQIPSLNFLRRLRDRLTWINTYETIVSGGDPYVGKREIFSLTDMIWFKEEGVKVLASADKEKLEAINEYVETGQAYDAAAASYFLQNSELNKVDLAELDAKIDDMVDRLRKAGKDRLFVTLETYSHLLDLKAQEPLIKFLRLYSTQKHELFDTNQTLSELQNCGFRYDSTEIEADLAKSREWLDSTCKILKEVHLIKSSRPKQRLSTHTMKMASDPELLRTAFVIFNKCAIAFAGEDVDGFVRSLSWIFYKNLDVQFKPNNPARYCMCRDFEDGVMIECDRCHEWYHVTCANAKSDMEDENSKYSCPVCLLLEDFKQTGEFKAPAGKISLEVLFDVIAKGEALRIVPKPEVQLLKDIADLLTRAMSYFEMRKQAVLNTHYETLYSSFLSRKFFGSPITISEPITSLFRYLKDVDLPGVFKAEARDRELRAQAEKAEKERQELQKQLEAEYRQNAPPVKYGPPMYGPISGPDVVDYPTAPIQEAPLTFVNSTIPTVAKKVNEKNLPANVTGTASLNPVPSLNVTLNVAGVPPYARPQDTRPEMAQYSQVGYGEHTQSNNVFAQAQAVPQASEFTRNQVTAHIPPFTQENENLGIPARQPSSASPHPEVAPAPQTLPAQQDFVSVSQPQVLQPNITGEVATPTTIQSGAQRNSGPPQSENNHSAEPKKEASEFPPLPPVQICPAKPETTQQMDSVKQTEKPPEAQQLAKTENARPQNFNRVENSETAVPFQSKSVASSDPVIPKPETTQDRLLSPGEKILADTLAQSIGLSMATESEQKSQSPVNVIKIENEPTLSSPLPTETREPIKSVPEGPKEE